MDNVNPVLPENTATPEQTQPVKRESDNLISACVNASKEVEKIESKGLDTYIGLGQRIADYVAARFYETGCERQGTNAPVRNSELDKLLDGSLKGNLLSLAYATVSAANAKAGLTYGGDTQLSRCLKLWALNTIAPALRDAKPSIGRNRQEALLPVVRFNVGDSWTPIADWVTIGVSDDGKHRMTWGDEGFGETLIARVLDKDAENYLRTADDIITARKLTEKTAQDLFKQRMNGIGAATTTTTETVETVVATETGPTMTDADAIGKLFQRFMTFASSLADGKATTDTEGQMELAKVATRILDIVPPSVLASALAGDKVAMAKVAAAQSIMAMDSGVTPSNVIS